VYLENTIQQQKKIINTKMNKKNIYQYVVGFFLASILLFIEIYFSIKNYSIIPLVDGWPLLDRIMHYKCGAINLPQYLFLQHGSHLHSLIYAIGLIDYDYFGGLQYLQYGLSLISVALICFFVTSIFYIRTNKLDIPIYVKNTCPILIVLIISTLSDWQEMLIPFQGVLTISRLVYFILLYGIIYSVVNDKIILYYYLIIFSIIAGTFHGTGVLFCVTIIIIQFIYLRKRISLLILSFVPLLATCAIKMFFNKTTSEESSIGIIFSLHGMTNVLLGMFSYFAIPLKLIIPNINDWISVSIGALIFIYCIYRIFKIYGNYRENYKKTIIFSRCGLIFEESTYNLLYTSIIVLSILSACAAAVFWVIRYNISNRIDGLPLQEILLTTRYNSFIALVYSFALIDIVIISSKYKYTIINCFVGPIIALVTITSLFSNYKSCKSYSRNDLLNSAGAALLSGVPLYSEHTDAIWPEAYKDWYWVDELPKLMIFLKKEGKSVWHNVPLLSTKCDDCAIQIKLHNTHTTKIPKTSMCKIYAQASNPPLYPIHPIVDSDRNVIGYGSIFKSKNYYDKCIIVGFAPNEEMLKKEYCQTMSIEK